MKVLTIFFQATIILYFITRIASDLMGQVLISGKIDSLGLKQGNWIYLYEKHELIPTGEKAYVIANYSDDTLSGEYKVFSIDSSYMYFFNVEKSILNGFAYLILNGQIRKTFYYIDSLNCFVNEYDKKGRLYRSYSLTDNKKNGTYIYYHKGKIIIKRIYKMDVILNEEINKLNKRKNVLNKLAWN